MIPWNYSDLPEGRSLFFLRMRIVPKEGCFDIVESGDAESGVNDRLHGGVVCR